MKLRLLENTIRMRLTRDEVDALLTNVEVMSWVHFPNGKKLTYGVMLTDGQIRVDFAESQLTLSAPRLELEDWSESEKVGFNWTIALENGKGNLEILLEKDFQCLKDRPGEDEAKMYPNPNRVTDNYFAK
jgi:hypothetical protein